MASRAGSKNKPKTADFYVQKLKDLGVNVEVLKDGVGDALKQVQQSIVASTDLPVTKKDIQDTPFIVPTEIKEDESFICGECGGEVTRGVSKCNKCGSTLNWSSI